MVKYYGFQYWWPAYSPLQVAEGAVLTQNTKWINAEASIVNLRKFEPQELVEMEESRLSELIKKSGFSRVKSRYLKNVISFYLRDVETSSSFFNIRNDLMNVKGIGKETSDAVALYSFHQRTIPIDSYTIRFLNRFFGFRFSIEDYEYLRQEFVRAFNEEGLMELHALIDEHSKRFCRKNPICERCPFNLTCKKSVNYAAADKSPPVHYFP